MIEMNSEIDEDSMIEMNSLSSLSLNHWVFINLYCLPILSLHNIVDWTSSINSIRRDNRDRDIEDWETMNSWMLRILIIPVSIVSQSLILSISLPSIILLIEEVQSAMLHNDRMEETETMKTQWLRDWETMNLWMLRRLIISISIVLLLSILCHYITSQNELLQLIVLERRRDNEDREIEMKQ